MNSVSADILSLSSEAALVIHGGRIVFANSPAKAIIGEGCENKTFSSIFPPEITQSQSSAFIADGLVAGMPYIIRSTRLKSDTLIFLSPSELPREAMGESFICAMRNNLMANELAASLLRSRAAELKDDSLLENIAVLNRSHYRMVCLVNNASFVMENRTSPESLLMTCINISDYFGSLVAETAKFVSDADILYEADSDVMLTAEPDMMKTLLFNLISNCLIHAHECSRIKVSVRNAGDSIVLTVIDNGCGIEPEAMPGIFERYRQGFDLCTAGNGAGLGLSVVRNIARLHDGTVLLESRPDWGTTVRVSFSKKQPMNSIFRSVSVPGISTQDILTGLSCFLPPEYYS